jgi:hypothetical protein
MWQGRPNFLQHASTNAASASDSSPRSWWFAWAVQQDHRVEAAGDRHQQSPIPRDELVVFQPRSDLAREIRHGRRLVGPIPTGEPRDGSPCGG